MHPNPAFRQTPDARNIAFARERAFGTLAVNGTSAPVLSHVPFILSEDGTQAELHLVRSNPIARLDLPTPAVISVIGPDGYISPDWYGVEDQVPTWNYIAVHLRGTLHPLPQEDMRDLLERLSDEFEGRLWDKAPWTTAKMSPGVMEKMMRMIVPFQLEVTQIDGTWKLGQNKAESARLGAARSVEDGVGSNLGELAQHMRTPPET